MTTQEVRHCGEIVAMVVATNVAAAKDAAELVDIDYEPVPAVTHSVAAVAEGAPLARGDATSNISIDAEVGEQSRHRCRVRQSGPHREVRDLDPAHRRRADGAARRYRHL